MERLSSDTMKIWSLIPNSFGGMLVYFTLLIPFMSFCTPTVSVNSATQLPPFYWNYSNPFFQRNTSNKMNVKRHGSLDILCPLYPVTSDRSTWEYYVIYMVTKQEFDNCNIIDPEDSLMVLNCSDPPNEKLFFTLWWDSFNAFPHVPDFISDVYYLITTSTGEQNGLGNRIREDGACYTENMKLEINIIEENTNISQDSTSTTTTTPHRHTTPHVVTTKTSTSAPTTTKTTKRLTQAPVLTTHKPSTTTHFPGGQPSDPSIPVIDATGNKNSGLINSARTLRPSWTIVVLLLLTLSYLVQTQR